MIREKISNVQSGYDLVADEYARRLYDELRNKELDCQLLDRLAESVRHSGLVCDLGCGPGQIARYLHECGVHVCGMDLSAGMVAHARRLNPGIEFSEGDMRTLPVESNTWAGIAAFYAIVNLTPSDVLQALSEMLRVLLPGGRVLLSFHIGEDTSQVEYLWDSGAALEFYFFRVETVAGYFRKAGFEIEQIIEREPYAPEVEYQSRRAYIFARKPGATITSA
ncbi:MAG TPA: methyltransferase domain-containing protein [Candidatus Sulfotelmatobacter sp.]|jgi:ubiquinone/menaquinone biosynthesis C-methylase UbiE|nr:methyltransferase domain-containing protein [Candidatus Sulfotelmatobacter sp.]